MIRSILRSMFNDQRGGIAILTSLGFLLFSVPLITASLGLAQNTSIDARIKTVVVQRQYCGLAVEEYFNYLTSDNTRWSNWLANNVDPSDPSGATSTETVNPCGKSITITVTQQPAIPSGPAPDPDDGFAITPQISVFDGREFQVTKTVSNPNPNGGDSVTYTITIVNRDVNALNLEKVQDTLPSGFSYDCNPPVDQLTLPNTAPQDFVPKDHVVRCVEGDNTKLEIEWELPPNTSIAPGAKVTLTFNALTSSIDGNYCNQAEVVPGGDKTTNGLTAKLQIGATSGPCLGDSVVVTKSVDSASLVATDTSTVPYTYTFNIDFTIRIDNLGTQNLIIKELIDYLPVGFSYVSTSSSGDLTDGPENLQQVVEINRQRVKWKTDPEVALVSGASKTLKFSTTATITKGNYYSDLLVEFGNGLFSEDRYTWPTALVSVKDVYDVTATDDDDNALLIALQVWIGDQNGVINTWDLK